LGQDWPRALQYQTRAGEQAQQLFANHEAIDHFTKALESAAHLSPDSPRPQRLRLHLALGEALVNTSEYDRALEHLSRGRALALELRDEEAEARACRWLAR